MGTSSRIAVDFDGVLHSYASGWQGADVINDPPTPGAIDWLQDVTRRYRVSIQSTRCSTPAGCQAIAQWLADNGLPALNVGPLEGRVTIDAEKLPALVYLDDRACRFDGLHWPTIDELAAMTPWWWKGERH